MTSVLPPPQSAAPRVTHSAEHELMRLRQGNHYLKVALDQASEGILILMPEQNGREPYVIYSNCQANLLAGADPVEGLRPRTLDSLAANDEAAAILRRALRQAVGSAGSATCECALKTPFADGSRDCAWHVRAVVNEHGVLLNYTVRFSALAERAPARATERVADEDADAQAARLRTENMAALSQGIAHDVNNLLGPMMTQISSTMQRVSGLPDIQAELQLIFAALKRARKFTQQVVKSSRNRDHEQGPTNLESLVRDMTPVCTAGSNVEVAINVENGLPWVSADPVRMTQVFQNLVMNGMQAMPNGGRMFIDMAVCCLNEGNQEGLPAGAYVEIKVRDRGIGMTEEVRQRLFKEPFTTKKNGSGIGLTTCNRFVNERGGRILVSSTPNIGSEFRVLLPATAPQNQPAGSESSLTAPIPLQPGSGRVLLVDDEEPIRNVARTILTRCGYEVMEVDNGEDAIATYKAEARNGEPFDVVLMDLTLRGGLTGTETARQMLDFDPDARLIVTSGSVTEEIQRLFLDDGFSAVLPKPYEAGALTQVVWKLITGVPVA